MDDVDVGKPRLPWTAAGDGIGRATAFGSGRRARERGAAAVRATRALGQPGDVAASGGGVGPTACGRAWGAGSTAAWGSTA
jgi:hypothetical protein